MDQTSKLQLSLKSVKEIQVDSQIMESSLKSSNEVRVKSQSSKQVLVKTQVLW